MCVSIGDPFICVDIYIHTCRARWLYMPADVPTRARDGDGRIVGARKSHARVLARRCSRMRAHTHLSHKYLYAYTYIHKTYTYIYIYIYIYHACIYIYILCAQSHARVHASRCSRMRAHTRLSHEHTYVPIHICMYTYNACIHIYTNIGIRIHTCV